MKICVIGAGSVYTPELIEGFIKFKSELPVKLITLFDIDRNRLEIVGNLTERMLKKHASGISVELANSRTAAIKGSAFVITQIRVGGQQARHRDTMLGLNHGVIGQETVGVGGFAKALRTIPVILDICKDIKKYAPNAWLINFTNPSGIVTEAVIKYGGVKVIGLCNGPIGQHMRIAKMLKLPIEKVKLDFVGLNHLTFIRKVLVNGKDHINTIMKRIYDIKPPRNIKQLKFHPRFIQALRKLPTSYLQYYYLKDQELQHLLSEKQTRAQVVEKISKKLLKMYQDPKLDHKPKLLEKRGGANYSTAAVRLINAIYNNKKEVHIIDCRNGDAIKELPADCVVEVPAVIDKNGAHPLKAGKLEPEIRGLMNLVKAYEELTVEAAVHKSYKLAVLALANNPLVPNVNLAVVLLDKLLKINGLKFK